VNNKVKGEWDSKNDNKKLNIAHGICKSNLGWNSNKRQNRKIIECLLKRVFLRYLPKFNLVKTSKWRACWGCSNLIVSCGDLVSTLRKI